VRARLNHGCLVCPGALSAVDVTSAPNTATQTQLGVADRRAKRPPKRNLRERRDNRRGKGRGLPGPTYSYLRLGGARKRATGHSLRRSGVQVSGSGQRASVTAPTLIRRRRRASGSRGTPRRARGSGPRTPSAAGGPVPPCPALWPSALGRRRRTRGPSAVLLADVAWDRQWRWLRG
jgi:hypothetical protein